MKKSFLLILVIIISALFLYAFDIQTNQSFDDLENIQLAESLPESEAIDERVTYKDLIRLHNLQAEQVIASPLLIKGEARGAWFFEGDFPVFLKDQAGEVLAIGLAHAETDWMSAAYVPFTARLVFTVPPASKNGLLVLQKNNPSGLAEQADAYELDVQFE